MIAWKPGDVYALGSALVFVRRVVTFIWTIDYYTKPMRGLTDLVLVRNILIAPLTHLPVFANLYLNACQAVLGPFCVSKFLIIQRTAGACL
jgi:hypothetical protein